MKKDNRGFTLVELIVVIAIMGILATVTGISLSTAGSARAKSCAAKLDTYISQCRASCLTREGANVHIELTRDGDGKLIGNYYEGDDDTNPKSTTVLAASGITVTCYFDADAAGTEIDAAHPLTLAFDRGTGALKKSSDTRYCAKLEIAPSGGGRSYTLTLVQATGAHSLS